jgi:Ser/Thr protein kinase RdoA (MazF antagonist)
VELLPLFDAPELVAHQDYCPGNVVFRHGLPRAFIDVDLSRPTTCVADCVNALYWWVPLLHPLDRPSSLTSPTLEIALASSPTRTG